MVILLHNLIIFVWIQHSFLVNTIFILSSFQTNYIENWQFMVIFLHTLYCFVEILHGCFVKMVFAFDPCKSVIKRGCGVYPNKKCLNYKEQDLSPDKTAHLILRILFLEDSKSVTLILT